MLSRLSLIALLIAVPCSAQALGMKECGEKYRAAQKAGTLNGLGWNAFRQQTCTSDISAPAASAASTAPSAETTPAEVAAAPTPATAEPSSGLDPVLPSAISPSFSKETPSKGRRLTCLEQYRANKKTGGNGSLKWIQKGGGYYSLCSKRLRG
jgi:hypothetical protein